MRRLLAALLLLLAGNARADDLALDGALTQGGLMVGRTLPGATVTLDGRPLRLTDDGRFLFGFGRDHGPAAVLVLRRADGSDETRHLAVAPRQYDIQRIEGLPPRQITPSPEDLARIKRERALIDAAWARDSGPGFSAAFAWPVLGPISGIYGSQRILNGEPRQPHYGVDVAAPAGTPVGAAADGTVSLAEPDLFFTGGTVVIDHGHGLSSTYSHLSAVLVAPGQAVRQGEPIGRVGATGRVTAAHLDWRLTWRGERLDPQLTVPPMPKS